MNKALFFPLFVNDYDELQLTTLKRKYGIKGYGVYTFLRTKLQDVDNYEYPIKLIPDLAYLAGIPETEMSDIIYNSSLFVIGNEFFSCPLLDEALNRHNGIIEKKTGQGKKGGQARMSTLSEEQRKELSRKGHEARYGKQKSHVDTNSIDVPAIKSEVSTNSSNVPANNINAGSTGNNLPSNAGNLPSNEIDIEREREIDIERETDTETEREIETEREKETDIESTRVSSKGSSSNVASGSTPPQSFHYSPIEVEKQIKKYLNKDSKFFFGDNQNIVINAYINFYNEFPTTIDTVEGFEQVLYVHLQSLLSSPSKYIENTKDLNDVLDNTENLIITPSSIMDLMQRIKDNKNDNKDTFHKIIHKVFDNNTNDNI
jgi:hypothetical protein